MSDLAERIRRRLANESEGNVYLDISWVMSVIAEEDARPAPDTALDVARLARALILSGLYVDETPEAPDALAATIAAEYAALTPKEPTE